VIKPFDESQPYVPAITLIGNRCIIKPVAKNHNPLFKEGFDYFLDMLGPGCFVEE
jgi:hypothetical protein